MRISDWSSDVCSSDLFSLRKQPKLPGPEKRRRNVSKSAPQKARYNHPHALAFSVSSPESSGIGPAISGHRAQGRQVRLQGRYQNLESAAARARARSEEHTSELQSLMRISYAVFCSTKTNNNQHPDIHLNTNKTI